MFHDYLEEFDTKHMRKAVIELFQVLDTKPEDRDPYMEESLAQFPYVNGGLFANEDIEIPQFTDEIRNPLLEKASADFLRQDAPAVCTTPALKIFIKSLIRCFWMN